MEWNEPQPEKKMISYTQFSICSQRKIKRQTNSKSIDTQGSYKTEQYKTMKLNDKVRKGKLQTWSKLLLLKQVYNMFPCVIQLYNPHQACSDCFARDAILLCWRSIWWLHHLAQNLPKHLCSTLYTTIKEPRRTYKLTENGKRYKG